MGMTFIEVPDAPKPGGHYSQAVVANGFVFVSGQLPFDADGAMPEGIEDQARLVLSHVAAILNGAGSGLDQVVSATVFVSDIAHWPVANKVWAEVFGAHRPARAIAVSPELHYGAKIEVTVTALAAT
ncbi:MAG: RidA family protein [Pseudomonadota bacterium]|nr:RidA family protein [Pseudomonadota bacterium]